MPPPVEPKKLLRQKLRQKILDKSIGRSSIQTKEHILYSELKKAGVDVDEFKKQMDILSSGGKSSFDATLKKS